MVLLCWIMMRGTGYTGWRQPSYGRQAHWSQPDWVTATVGLTQALRQSLCSDWRQGKLALVQCVLSGASRHDAAVYSMAGKASQRRHSVALLPAACLG
jgi:hypothetical protein